VKANFICEILGENAVCAGIKYLNTAVINVVPVTPPEQNGALSAM
jgi:hypothetical protein